MASLQQRFLDLVFKYMKWIIFGILFVIALIIVNVINSNIDEKNALKFTSNIELIQENITKKEYIKASDTLSLMKKKSLNEFQENYLLVQEFKLARLQNKDIQEIAKKIKNINYSCQYRQYDKFSMSGEFLLLCKMILHFRDKEYAECAQMIQTKYMIYTNHNFSYLYRALAEKDINPDNARLHLINIITYHRSLDQLSKMLLQSLLNSL